MQPQTPTLPSVVAAQAVLTNQPGGWALLAKSLALRSAIVAPALWLAGVRDKKKLLWQTAVVVGAIELVVLNEISRQMKATRAETPDALR